MKPLARKVVAASLSLALLGSGVPPIAWAQAAGPVAPVAAPAAVDPNVAMKMFRDLQVYKGEDDVLKTYLGGPGGLTELGKSLYFSLLTRYNKKEEVESMAPTFDRLRQSGPYTAAKSENVSRALKIFQERFGSIGAGDGTVEGDFRRIAMGEAALTGAMVADPPKAGQFLRVDVPEGIELWDKTGLAYRLNKNNVTTYNRELQKAQRAMNQNRPTQAELIPETGRYNVQTFGYNYWSLKNRYDELANARRLTRMMALAELLHHQFRDDQWHKDPNLEAELVREAGKKTYRFGERTYTVLSMVDDKLAQRDYYLAGAQERVGKYLAQMENLKKFDVITDAQAGSMSLYEQNATKWLALSVVETQMYQIRDQIERLDPASPDSKQIQKGIDESDMSAETKVRYKQQGLKMKAQLEQLRLILERSRNALSGEDYAGSLGLVNAALSASQKQLGELTTDYAAYVEVPTSSSFARSQTEVRNPVTKFFRWGWAQISPEYGENMLKIRESRPQYDKIAYLIADGNMGDARQAIIAMNPDATKNVWEVSFNGGDAPKLTDAVRVNASMKESRDRFNAVAPVNRRLDAAAGFVTTIIVAAVVAPLGGRFLTGVGEKTAIWSQGALSLASAPGRGAFTGFALRGTSLALQIVSEITLHTAARLQSLIPAKSWVDAQASSYLGRMAVQRAVIALNAGARQGSFTLLSSGISGAFTTVKHWTDPLHLEVGGYTIMKRAPSMFSNSGEAFLTGAEGGAIWANESFHPLLGYVGLPSSAFRGTWASGMMDSLGARGVVGNFTALTNKIFGRSAVATVEGAAKKGFLEKLAEGGAWAKTGAFTLSMADNVLKYALFSEAVAAAGRVYTYHWGGLSTDTVERRIKRSHQVEQALLESPAWMLIPTHSAWQARHQSSQMRAIEGVRQAEEAGLLLEVVKAGEQGEVRFRKTPPTPMAQRFFDLGWKTHSDGDYWVVTKEVYRYAVSKVMGENVTGKKGAGVKLAEANPYEFYKISQMESGMRYMDLEINDVIKSVAHEKFIETLVARPQMSTKILEAKPGDRVDGFGFVRPKVQEDVAMALYSAEAMFGHKVPEAVGRLVRSVLKDYIAANEVVTKPALGLRTAVHKAPVTSAALDKALDEMNARVAEWKREEGPHAAKSYQELITVLREEANVKLTSKELNPREHAVMSSLFNYVEAIETRFNFFNKADKTHAQGVKILKAVEAEFGGRGEGAKLLKEFATEFEAWAKGRGDKAVQGPRADKSFDTMIQSFRERLETVRKADRELPADKRRLTKVQSEALDGVVAEIEAAPWVLHNVKGQALPSWKPEQFEALMSALGAYAKMGRGGNTGFSLATLISYAKTRGQGQTVRMFQMLKTGGGKTMLSFEGLLPLIEADAKIRKKKVIFLTVQSNLEAQARMDFLALRKLGSTITFDTYEGFKTKIADGKSKGKNVLKDYWILGDEMDGAALQPALTIGEVTGRVSRMNGTYQRLVELDTGLVARVENSALERGARMRTEARRVLTVLREMDVANLEAFQAQARALEKASEELISATGPLAVFRAEQSIARAKKNLETMLDLVAGNADLVVRIRSALIEFEGAMKLRPGEAAAYRDALGKDLKRGLSEQRNLLEIIEAKDGLKRLPVEARKMRLELEVRLDRLNKELEAAEAGKKSGSEELAGSLRAEIELLNAQKKLVERFEFVDPSSRLVRLDEKIVALESELIGVTNPPAKKLAKLDALRSESSELYAKLTPERQSMHSEHRAELGKVYEIGRQMQVLDDAILIARGKLEGKPVAGKTAEQLKGEFDALESLRAGSRDNAGRLKARLGAGSADGDLGAVVRRLEVAGREIQLLQARIESAKGSEKASLSSKLSQLKSEDARLRESVASEYRKSFRETGEEILALVGEGKTGWEANARRLIETRRRLIKSFAGDESPIYTIYRNMKEDVRSIATNSQVRSPDAAVAAEAVGKLMRRVDGPSLLKALSPIQRRTVGAAEGEAGAEGALATKLTFEVPPIFKLFWRTLTGKAVEMPVGHVGLTRMHAADLLREILRDPMMPRAQRDSMFWKALGSLLWPKGMSGRGSSYVRTELINLIHGYFDDAAGVRLDGRTGRFNVVHNGQWFESMDNPTRRWWELEYGVDLTLPYTHQSMSTIKDVTTFRGANFISFSGTAGKEFKGHLGKYDVSVVGEGSKAPAHVSMEVVASQGASFEAVYHALVRMSGQRGEVYVPHLRDAPPEVRAAIEAKLGRPVDKPTALRLSEFEGAAGEWLMGVRLRQGDSNLFVLKTTDKMPTAVETAVQGYLAKNGLTKEFAGKKSAVIEISKVESAEAQTWLREQRATQEGTGLLVLSVSDTRVLKIVEQYLERSGIKQSEIAKVFSDTEHLRLNAPEAKAGEQMNLEALGGGKAKVLILDTRVGGRGLDLNFKGKGGFRGYTNFEMLIVDPHQMSAVHLLQAMGRIDTGRILSAADRRFSLVMDVKTVQGEGVFRRMFAEEPFFVELRKDPVVAEFAKRMGVKEMDWSVIHQYVDHRSRDGSAEGLRLLMDYKKVVKERLEARQSEVELNQLRSSSVVNDAPMSSGRFPGLEYIR